MQYRVIANRSMRYLGSFNYQSDQAEITQLRAEVKAVHGPGWRVKLQGRKGSSMIPVQNNRAATFVALADSGYVDAYLYRRDGWDILGMKSPLSFSM